MVCVWCVCVCVCVCVCGVCRDESELFIKQVNIILALRHSSTIDIEFSYFWIGSNIIIVFSCTLSVLHCVKLLSLHYIVLGCFVCYIVVSLCVLHSVPLCLFYIMFSV